MGSVWKSFWLQGFGSVGVKSFFFSRCTTVVHISWDTFFFATPLRSASRAARPAGQTAVWLQFESTRHGSVQPLTRAGRVTVRQLLPSSTPPTPHSPLANQATPSSSWCNYSHTAAVWCEDDGVLYGRCDRFDLLLKFSFVLNMLLLRTLLTWSHTVNKIYNTTKKLDMYFLSVVNCYRLNTFFCTIVNLNYL